MSEFLSEYAHLMSDPAHIAVEVTFIFLVDVLIGMVAWPIVKRLVKRHDRDHHSSERVDA